MDYPVFRIYKQGVDGKSHEKHMDRITGSNEHTMTGRQLFSELEPSEPCEKGRCDFAIACEYGIAGHIRYVHSITPGTVLIFGKGHFSKFTLSPDIISEVIRTKDRDNSPPTTSSALVRRILCKPIDRDISPPVTFSALLRSVPCLLADKKLTLSYNHI